MATMAIDLNRTHATNPKWPSHARFHLVWQVMTVAILSTVEVALIWWRGPFEEQRFYVTLSLASVPCVAFLLALLSQRIYGGSLSEPNGIPRGRIVIFGKVFHGDLNLAAVVAASLSLAAIYEIYQC